MIAIIDYGVGNLFSLKSSLAAIGAEAVVTRDQQVLDQADHIILPGVGAFGDAANKLRETGMFQVVLDQAASGKPLLEVRPIRPVIPAELDVPHMGWNGLHFPKDRARSPIFADLNEGDHVYFVHSFAGFDCGDCCTATAEYGTELTAAVQKDNVFGTQFHPEKSGDVGLKILKAFCQWR